MANLSPDYISWVLTLNTDQAREEISKLEKENRELSKQTTEARKQLAQLAAQGKKNTDEYRNLDKAIRDNNRDMQINRDRIAALSKQIDVSKMTVSELKKHLKELKREFEHTSKAANPKAYETLRSKITEVRAAIDKANSETRGLAGAFFSLTKMREVLHGFFWGIGQGILDTVVGAFKQATSTIMDFEASNAKLAAILGTNIEGISSLTEQAKFLGPTTTATASDVTSLQTELAKLGFTTDSIEAMTPAVLKFSQAVDTDLGRASAFAGAALRIFGKDAADT